MRGRERTACPLAAMAAVLLLLLAGTVSAQSTVISRAIAEAREAMNRGDAARAVAVLKEATRQEPGAVEARELLARALDQAGRKDDAKRTGEEILRAFPDRTRTRLWLAQCLERDGEFTAARPHFGRALRELKPGTESARSARLGLARILLESGSTAEARTVLAPLTGARPDEAAVRLEIRTWRRDGRLDLAIDAARRRIDRVPGVADQLASLLHESGMAAAKAGDLKLASLRLRESAGLVPNIQVELDLARILARSGKDDEADRVLQSAAERAAKPGVPTKVTLGVADALGSVGRPGDGLALVQVARDRGAEKRDLRPVELRCLIGLGREAEVRGRLDAMVDHGASDRDRQESSLTVLRDSPRLPDHVDHLLDRGFRAVPEVVPTWLYLLRKAGRSALKRDKPARARRFLTEAARLSPEDRSIRRELGWAEFAAGDPDSALRLWAADLAELDPSPDLLAAAARCHHAAGRLDDAVSIAARASAAAPGSSDIRRLHWRLLDEAGRDAELASAMDPGGIDSIQSADAVAAAAILARRHHDPAFRRRLEQWLNRQPESPELKHVAARASRDQARSAWTHDELERAAAHARRAVALAPDAAWTHRELGGILEADGDHEGALRAFRQALRLEPDNLGMRVRVLNALMVTRGWKEAGAVLAAAPESAESDSRFLLAATRILLAMEQPRRGEARARKLVSLAESDGDDRVRRQGQSLLVSCLVKADDVEAALEALEAFLQRRPDEAASMQRYVVVCAWSGNNRRLVAFLNRLERAFPREVAICAVLARHYMDVGERRRASRALERCVALAPNDPVHWSNLGRNELDRGNHSAARGAFERARSLRPDAAWLRLGLGDVELSAGRYEKAIEIADAILVENPWLQPALWLKVQALQRGGDADAALRTWESMYGFMVDDSEHYLVRGRILYREKRFAEARTQLEQVLTQCEAGVLPILVYHGVSDDMQPATIHDRQLRDQLRALRDAGYVAIGLRDMEDWLAGKRKLPDRAILITFDDARLDNLLFADPVLREVGYRAVQFVPTARIALNRTFHMSWRDLRNLRDSGRWEVGAHGHRAHDRVGIDLAGADSPYLAARRWLKGAGRLESRTEFDSRIDGDYRLCQQELDRALGVRDTPYYAFSFNDFGQREISNAPWIFQLNEQSLSRYYRRGFHQSGGAFNIRTSPDMRYLARLSVPVHWSGDELVNFLLRNHPEARTRLELARMNSWVGDYNAALEELDRAERAGAEPKEVLKVRAHAMMWRGDAVRAGDAFRSLLDLDPTDSASAETLGRLERDRRPAATASFDYWWDSDDRSIFGQTLRGELEAARGVRLFGSVRHARYAERRKDDISGWSPRVGGEATLGGSMILSAAIGQTFFSGAKDQVDYDAAARWNGVDRIMLSASFSGGAVQTVSAIEEDVRQDTQTGFARYRLTPDDQVSLSLRNAIYSDGNNRQTLRLRYSHRVSDAPVAWIGYEGVYDNAKDEEPEYYTPQTLHQHLAFARLSTDLTEQIELSARVAGGWGAEDGDGQFVGQAYLRAVWQVRDNLQFSGEIGHNHNPDYYATFVSAGLELRF